MEKNMKEYVLETKSVTKSYGSLLALDRTDIHVEKGSIYGLIGDNGAGKSTLLKLLAGHVFATSGEIFLFGQKEKKELERCRRQTGAIIERLLSRTDGPADAGILPHTAGNSRKGKS